MTNQLVSKTLETSSTKIDLKNFDSTKVNFDDFQKNIETVPSETRKQWHKAAMKLEDEAGKGLSGALATRIRNANFSTENRDPHLILFSLYLQKEAGKKDTFHVNFQEGAPSGKTLSLAENKVGMGEMFPQTVDKVAVETSDGRKMIGIRMLVPETGREDYCEEKALQEKPPRYARIAVFTGDKITVDERIPAVEAQKKWDKLKSEHQVYTQSHARRDVMATEIAGGSAGVDRRIGQRSAASRTYLGFPSRAPRVQQSAPSEVAGYTKVPFQKAPEALEQNNIRVDRFLEAAQNTADPNHPDYRRFDDAFNRRYPIELRNGAIGCGYVVSSFLKDAGYWDGDPINLASVAGIENILPENGWRKGKQGEKPLRGCIIIWEKTVKVTKKADGKTDIQPGHEHIGIALNAKRAIDNHFGRNGGAGPMEDNIYGRMMDDGKGGTHERKVRAIYFPPEEPAIPVEPRRRLTGTPDDQATVDPQSPRRLEVLGREGLSEPIFNPNGHYTKNMRIGNWEKALEIKKTIAPPPGYRSQPLAQSQVTREISSYANTILRDQQLNNYGDGIPFTTRDGKKYFGMLDPHPAHPVGHPNRIDHPHTGVTVHPALEKDNRTASTAGQEKQIGFRTGGIDQRTAKSDHQQERPSSARESKESSNLHEVFRNTERWLPLIRESCARRFSDETNRKILENLVQAIMQVESKGDPNAIGINKDPRTKQERSRDQGLMQLNNRFHHGPQIMDPAVNIETGIGVIMSNYQKYGWNNIQKIIFAYNCGDGEGIIPESTKEYYSKVIKYFNALQQQNQ